MMSQLHTNVFCMETKHGVLTDLLNRPIVLSIGMVYGTIEEMTLQVKMVKILGNFCFKIII